jgi:hypothetical protein
MLPNEWKEARDQDRWWEKEQLCRIAAGRAQVQRAVDWMHKEPLSPISCRVNLAGYGAVTVTRNGTVFDQTGILHDYCVNQDHRDRSGAYADECQNY